MSNIEETLHYKFKDKKLLEEALTHPSISRQNHASDRPFNYERLEFLGDAVLGLVIAELLILKYPNEKEGPLAKRQAGLVRGEAVTNVGKKLGIGSYIRMTQGEESMGGRENASNVENCLEALIGAIYRDGGLNEAAMFICKHWAKLVEEMKEPPKDSKTHLQEWAQARGLDIPSYRTIDAKGPSHAPEFVVEVEVSGYEPVTAIGDSKKKAEKEAARILLSVIEPTKLP